MPQDNALVPTGDDGAQTIPTYAPDGSFVGFLAPQAHRMYTMQMARQMGSQGSGGGGGNSAAGLIEVGADSAAASYALMSIGQLDSDFDKAKRARAKRIKAKAALVASVKAGGANDFADKLLTYLNADDDMSKYQNRVIDGQMKMFWVQAIANGGRAIGEIMGAGNQWGNDGSSVSGWVVAAGGAFLLATLFEQDSSNRNTPTD